MALEKTIDVLGIGNAIIDVLADADDAFLSVSYTHLRAHET